MDFDTTCKKSVPVKQRLVIWGGGNYGKIWYQCLNASAQYQVVGVIDKKQNVSVQETFHQAAFILSAYDLKEKYKQGFFDAVIICVRSRTGYQEVKKILEAQNLPVLELESIVAFESLHSQTSLEKKVFREYSIERIEHVRGKRVPERELFYLYSSQGDILKESWRYAYRFYQFNDMEQLSYPCEGDSEVYVDEECCVVATEWTGSNYWHCMYECMVCVYAMIENGFHGKFLCFESEIVRELMGLLGLDEKRIIYVGELDNSIYHFRELYHVEITPYMPKLFCKIADAIIAEVKKRTSVGQEYPKKIFVERIGQRKMLGADKILEQYGFKRIIPEQLPIREQIKYFNSADIVISPHGANSTNSMFMRLGTVFIECFSMAWISLCNVPTLKEKGVKYRMLVESGRNTKETAARNFWDDYTIQADVLEMTIQDAIREIQNSTIL